MAEFPEPLGFWGWLDRRGERKATLRRYQLEHPGSPAWNWPDARGWIGLAVFIMACAILAVMAIFPEVRKDEFMKTIATLIVGAFIKDVVGWAYQATKSGGELADRNASMVENHLTSTDQGAGQQNGSRK